MPVIVDEVVISIEVNNQPTAGAAARTPSNDEKQQIVATCVEQVLEILEQKKER